ncbi:MAG: hypothetical protein LBP26_04330 [Clostridiales bacterium]|jgi:hypothetical protein|nr:hypothetical protein [Clostridiales bacterium]
MKLTADQPAPFTGEYNVMSPSGRRIGLLVAVAGTILPPAGDMAYYETDEKSGQV